MPVLTNVQKYAVELLKKLRCVRHDQLHWMISQHYPLVNPDKVMRQVNYVTMAIDDGKHYCWTGCEVNPDRIAALDIMLKLCEDKIPIFDFAPYPCALIFFLEKTGTEHIQPFRVYAPREGDEAMCCAQAELQQHPKGHAAVFYIQNENQMPLLEVSRPHIFAISDGNGGYRFPKAAL